MILEEKHQKVAIAIVQKHRTKKSCPKCYDRGFIGFYADKTIIPCEKCVDIEKAMEDWKAYVAEDEQLKEHFHELFEEKNEDEKAEESADKHNPQSHRALSTNNNSKPPKNAPVKQVTGHSKKGG